MVTDSSDGQAGTLTAFGDQDAQWWVLHTRARNEKAVVRALQAHNVHTYLPLVRVAHMYAKRKVAFQVPLFPGYVFMHGRSSAREQALRTNRVANILEVRDQVKFHRELSQVETAVASGEQIELFPALRLGQRCRVTSGPLVDLEGVVIRQGNRCQIFLSVSILGQSAVVELDAALVEPIE